MMRVIQVKTIVSMKRIEITGDINGVNKEFVCEHVPLFITVNGQVKEEGIGYTIEDLTITLIDAPFTDETMRGYGNY